MDGSGGSRLSGLAGLRERGFGAARSRSRVFLQSVQPCGCTDFSYWGIGGAGLMLPQTRSYRWPAVKPTSSNCCRAFNISSIIASWTQSRQPAIRSLASLMAKHTRQPTGWQERYSPSPLAGVVLASRLARWSRKSWQSNCCLNWSRQVRGKPWAQRSSLDAPKRPVVTDA